MPLLHTELVGKVDAHSTGGLPNSQGTGKSCHQQSPDHEAALVPWILQLKFSMG